MFQRRLLLLMSAAVILMGVAVAQLGNLTIAQGAERRKQAESALTQGYLIPTIRGRVLDRKERLLAVDRPSDDIAINYSVITGEWAYRKGRREARSANRTRWSTISFEERELLIAGFQHKYEQQIDRMWTTLCTLSATPREEIEARRSAIARRVQQIASHVWIEQMRRRAAMNADELGRLPDDDAEEPLEAVREQRSAHAILTDVDAQAVSQIRQFIGAAQSQLATPAAATLPGSTAAPVVDEVWAQVKVQASTERAYPLETIRVQVDRRTFPGPLKDSHPLEIELEGIGSHIIGSMRNIWREDTDAAKRPLILAKGDGSEPFDLGGYLPGDKVGAWGAERSMEQKLRGNRGQVLEHLDTLAQDRREPAAGGDVVLSIDINLQARVQAVMDPRAGLMRAQPWHQKDAYLDPLRPQLGDPLVGSAIVLDIASGEVLAAVSTPALKRRELKENPAQVYEDAVNRPYLNRVIGQALQPGSLVKPLVLAAAISDRKLGYDEAITCNGFLDAGQPNRLRCWIFKGYHLTHGPLLGPEAIARSCNIFFFTLGRRMGGPKLVSWYDKFNLGRQTDCGLGEEVDGDLPSLAKSSSPIAPGFTLADATFMAIGQGPMLWTPLQAANAYATLARGGIALPPTFVLDSSRPRPTTDLGLDPKGVELALRGLDDAVNKDYGTAHHLAMLNKELIFNVPGVKIYGKSGTADAAPLRTDTDHSGKLTSRDRIIREGDHAWVVTLVKKPGSPRPDYVIIAVVEFGGSGAATAGPVVNQILHAMRAEGYL